MKRIFAIAATACLMVVATANPASAAQNVPVPASNFIVKGGIDWAWASPCAAFSPSCGTIDLSFQATQGWRIPTLAEFLARPKTSDFGNKCASQYFTTYSHCDFGDPNAGGVNADGQPMGYLYDYGYGITNNGSHPVADSWLVRGSLNNAVPEPATWLMMIMGFGLVGAAMRRKRETVQVSYG
jgi:hypothetical protein